MERPSHGTAELNRPVLALRSSPCAYDASPGTCASWSACKPSFCAASQSWLWPVRASRSWQPELSSWWRRRCRVPASRKPGQQRGRGRRGETSSWLFLLSVQVGFGWHHVGINRRHAKQLQSIREHPDSLRLLLVGAEPVCPFLKCLRRGDLRCRGMGFEGFVNLTAEIGAALVPGRRRYLCVGGSDCGCDERHAEQSTHHADPEPLHRSCPLLRKLALPPMT